MTTAVSVQGLGKDYLIGGPKQGYLTLRESLQQRFSPGRNAPVPGQRVLSALDDVSFELSAGEAVGFIGHNGAGKSTLLKVLARITAPTRGRVEMHGRVGALLEVATGFHPELTGRENVFLNGAILGMSRRETQRRFDEIVGFADVGRFIDTPVKRFSSGMVVRLAFSVAAHLEPEVLIVDEVLAVGDAAFRRRCLERLGQVHDEGRTVLVVSHDMAVVTALCSRGIVLREGRVVADAATAPAVAAYMRSLEDLERVDLSVREDRRGYGHTRIDRFDVHPPSQGVATTGAPLGFTVGFTQPLLGLACTLRLVNELGVTVSELDSADVGPDDAHGDAREFVCTVDELTLLPGRYRVDAELRSGPALQDQLQSVAMLDVAPGLVRGRAVSGDAEGDVVVPHRWVTPD